MLGAGYTGLREAGYDESAMNALRALGEKNDQPFFMLNLLKVIDIPMYMKYSAETEYSFKEYAKGEATYVGRLREAPVPVKGEGIDTSDYSVILLVKYPMISSFFKFIDSPEYQAAYPLRFGCLEDGKSTLISSFPLAGAATEGLITKVPGADD